MLLEPVFKLFVEQVPVCVGVRGIMEWALNAEAVDGLFGRVADVQYQRELLFSTCVDLMATVVCRTHKSVNVAYQRSQPAVGVSVQSLYDKLKGIEPQTSAELVRHTAQRLGPLIRRMKGTSPPLIAGYRVKVLDGNHLTKTERRLKVLRDVAAGPLPGQTLVVWDPELNLTIDVVCGEDGHAQERSLLKPILAGVEANDLWMADRNFCTTGVLFRIAAGGGYFVIRQHASTLSWEREGACVPQGRCETGAVSSQDLWLQNEAGETLKVRKITLTRDVPSPEGETEIHVLTNLPKSVKAARIMDLYRQRWRIESLFQDLTTTLKCEVNTLGYPPAALFAFCVALVANNVLATFRAALIATHGADKVAQEVSTYYMADELSGTYRGMLIALPPDKWKDLATWEVKTMANWLLSLARDADLKRYRKHPRGPKKPKPRRTRFAQKKHISTAKLLAAEKSPSHHKSKNTVKPKKRHP